MNTNIKVHQHVSEDCHYYQKDGTPCDKIVGKNGEPREPNIRDAKALGLYPGVTGIIKIKANPTLTNWLINNAIECTHDFVLGNATTDMYGAHVCTKTMDECKDAVKKYNEIARDRGTEMHLKIDRFLSQELTLDEIAKTDEVAANACSGIVALLQSFGLTSQDIETEVAFCNANLGFGGRVDCISKKGNFIFDWKTVSRERNFSYDSEKMQGAAYIKGLLMDEGCRMFDVIIDQKIGHVVPVENTKQELDDAWEMFEKLYDVWCLDKKYNPRSQS